ncbi:MAG: VOC family protein [Acidimicrobiales bacterium]
MSNVDVGLSHVALPVSDLDVSLEFYRRFANLEVVHRREDHPGHAVAWISDLTRPFVVVLLQTDLPSAGASLGGWAHLGVGCLSREEVDHRLGDAASAGFEVLGPCDDGPPVGYWGIIVDPDGHNLEVAFGQQVGVAVDHAHD